MPQTSRSAAASRAAPTSTAAAALHQRPAPPPAHVDNPLPIFGSKYVDADSRTPYTDATTFAAGGRRAGGAGGSGGGASKKKVRSSGGVRRPMNAFMVWSQQQRRIVSARDPGLHNAEISRRLGARWKKLSAAEQRPFVNEAEKLRDFHAREFPGYKYAPRKGRKKSLSQSSTSSSGGTAVAAASKTKTSSIRDRRSSSSSTAVSVAAAANLEPSSTDIELPVGLCADSYDSEVSSYFADDDDDLTGVNGVGNSVALQSTPLRGPDGRGRRRAIASLDVAAAAVATTTTPPPHQLQNGRRSLPPTPDSAGQSADVGGCRPGRGRAPRPVRFAGAVGGDRRRTAKPRPTTTTTEAAAAGSRCFRFDFGRSATSTSATSDEWNFVEDDLQRTGVRLDVDTPPSAFSATSSSIFGSPEDGTLTTGSECPVLGGGGGMGFVDVGVTSTSTAPSDCADYTTPEVTAMVCGDWLEENIRFESQQVWR